MTSYNPSFEAKKLCNLPDCPKDINWAVGFVDGQLLANGASYDLIRAVALGDWDKIRSELGEIIDPDRRDRLTRIVERIVPIVGRDV